MDYTYPTYEIERFTRDTADHDLTVLHDDGLYRHLRCKQPDSGFYWFDVITWPGHLSIVGDFGDGLTFARIEDMLTFFRAAAGWNMGRINPGYWAQKIVSGRGGVEKHSGTIFRQRVDEYVKDAIRDQPELDLVDNLHAGLTAAVNTALTDDYDGEYAEGAREFLRDFSYRYDPQPTGAVRVGDALAEALGTDRSAITVHPKRAAKFEFTDTWEWDFNDWDWSYLWACHAIQWAIDAYDKAKAAGVDAGPAVADVVDVQVPVGAVAA